MAEIKEATHPEQTLDEPALNAELAALVQRHQLPARIAQKIGQKIKDNNLRLTRDQLQRLVQYIQTALGTTPQSSDLTPTQTRPTTTLPNTDMKNLVDEIADLKERLQAIEHNTTENLHEVTRRLTSGRETTAAIMDTDHTSLQPLETIPSDPESIVLVMKWLTYLVERIGKPALPDVLGYYVDIGWISDDVRLDLLNYSKGITADTPQTQPPTTRLPTKDHLQSLLFIQKLKGIHLDDRFLFKIERELEKMTKSLDTYLAKPGS